jgi:glycosyltransferase involved in cell wall biosynthesis
MRIAWLTPWAPKSAIAQFSALVVGELRRVEGVEVDIWYPPGSGGRTVPDRGRHIDSHTLEELRGYDAVIYNFGNHQAYHGRIHELSLELPATVVLHDVVLTHMFVPGLLQLAPDAMARLFEDWYGPAGRREVTALRANPQAWLSAPGKVDRYPMLQPAMAGAEQIVTHSDYAARIVREHFIGDVHTLGLPALSWPGQVRPGGPSLDWLDDRPVVLQAGAVNSNKCVPLVVDAFAEHGLGERLQLVIAGHVQPEERASLERRVAAAGLTGTVHILGSVDDATMHALRGRATMATVLRSPVTESSSAVLIDSMAHGLAVVALESGHYKEHPSDVVQFLQLPASSKALGELLTAWADHPEVVAERGRAAAAYAARSHSARAYARGLLAVLPFRRAGHRRKLLAAAAADLVERNGFGLDSKLAGRVAEEAAALFGRVPNRGRH